MAMDIAVRQHTQGTSSSFSISFERISLMPDNTASKIQYTANLNGIPASDVLDLLLIQADIGAGRTTLLERVYSHLCFAEDLSNPNLCPNAERKLGNGSQTMYIDLKQGNNFVPGDNLANLFFCFATTNTDGALSVCHWYSGLFDLNGSPGSPTPFASSLIPISATSPNIIALVPTTTFTSEPTTVPTVTASMSITGTSTTYNTTITTYPTASSSSPTSESQASLPPSPTGLSTGAKIGIALGALFIFALILLGMLFCLRRKHSKRSARRSLDPNQPPEQVMLTRSMHSDSFGTAGPTHTNSNNMRAAIIAEKEDAIASTTALNSRGPSTPYTDNHHTLPLVAANATSPLSPQRDGEPHEEGESDLEAPPHSIISPRHSAVSPYVPLPSAPYAGHAASIPRRKPTNATTISASSHLSAISSTSPSNISRNISSSTTGARSPASANGDFSPYHDVPTYGDARHVPQVFSAPTHVPNQAPVASATTAMTMGRGSPFVTDGMSEDEVARLEEEERRIDAAIAEAEGRR